MDEYMEFSPDIKVSGEIILAFVLGMGKYKLFAYKILSTYGIEYPHPDQWYSQSDFLKCINNFRKKGGNNTLRVFGRNFYKKAIPPMENESVEDRLSKINLAYSNNHKGENIGEYKFIKTGNSSATIKCFTPYPCVVEQGIMESMAKNSISNKNHVIIRHLSDSCKSVGNKYGTFSVKW